MLQHPLQVENGAPSEWAVNHNITLYKGPGYGLKRVQLVNSPFSQKFKISFENSQISTKSENGAPSKWAVNQNITPYWGPDYAIMKVAAGQRTICIKMEFKIFLSGDKMLQNPLQVENGAPS